MEHSDFFHDMYLLYLCCLKLPTLTRLNNRVKRPTILYTRPQWGAAVMTLRAPPIGLLMGCVFVLRNVPIPKEVSRLKQLSPYIANEQCTLSSNYISVTYPWARYDTIMSGSC